MLRIDIITVVPELLGSPLSYSIPGRAVKKGLVEIHVHDLRKYGLGPRILCGHYKGIDERIREHLITREISVGDFVVSGGEIPAALLADSIIRLVPGVLTDETSALSDSFQDGLVSPPVYTRPAEFNGWKVPDVLLSGNPKLIQVWQDEQSILRTKERRPNLLK